MVILHNPAPVPTVLALDKTKNRENFIRECVQEIHSDNAEVRIQAYNTLRSATDEEIKNAWVTPVVPLGWEIDCLQSVIIKIPLVPIVCERAIILVITPGYEVMCLSFLATLEKRGGGNGATVVVFAVGSAMDMLEGVQGVTLIQCELIGRASTMVKGALYSAARYIQAKTYLSLEVDMLVTSNLSSLWEMADNFPVDGFAATAPTFSKDHPANSLKRTVSDMGMPPTDLGQLEAEDVGNRVFFNGGAFIATSKALHLIYAEFRRLAPRLIAWVQGGSYHSFNEEAALNICTHRTVSVLPLPPSYNIQVYNLDAWLDIKSYRASSGCMCYIQDKEEAKILHFVTVAKALIPKIFNEIMGEETEK